MAKRYGRDAVLGFGKESTWATPAARTEFVRIMGEGGGLDPGRKEIESWSGDSVISTYDFGRKAVKDFTTQLTFENLLEVHRNLFWTYAFNVQEAGRNQHQFKIGGTKPSSLTGECANTESNAFIYPGTFLRRIAYNFPDNGQPSLEMGFVAEDEDELTKTSSPTVPDLSTLLVKPPQFTVTVGGVSSDIRSGQVTVESGMDEGLVVYGQAGIAEQDLEDKWTVTCNLSRQWDDHGAYDDFKAGTAATIIISATGPTLLAGNYFFEIRLNNVYYQGESPRHEGPGATNENIVAVAQEDATYTACQVSFVNTQATLS